MLHRQTTLRALLVMTLIMPGAFFLSASNHAARAQDDVMTSPFQLFAGVIADTERGRLYIMSPKNEILAVSMEAGELVWSSREAIKPLMASLDRLVALAVTESQNRIAIVILNAEDGEVRSRQTVALPKDVHANIDQTLDGRFLAEGFLFGADVIVSWAFRHELIRGVNRGPQQVRVQSGLLRVSLEDGAVSTVKLNGDELKALQNNRLAHENRIVGNAIYVESVAADGRHAAKGKRAAGGADAKYDWEITSRPGGKAVANFPFEQGAYSPWFIRNDTIILRTMPYWKRSGPNDRPISEPLMLRALMLDKGTEVWNWEVRDTSYRGPIPP